MYGKASRRGRPGAVPDQIIIDLESEFDLMRLERHMAKLEREDRRLVAEIDALKARTEPPTFAAPSDYAVLPETGLTRWWRTLATAGRIFWLKARRERLVEEWQRCSVIAGDIRFGLRVTGAKVPRQ